MSSNDSKPSKGEIDRLIRSTKIDVAKLGKKKVALIALALEKEDPLEFIRSVARSQGKQVDEPSPAGDPPEDDPADDADTEEVETDDAASDSEPVDSDSGESPAAGTETPEPPAERPQPPQENVRRGDEVMRQSDQHTPFCPYCSDPAKNEYVLCKASGTKGPFTYYVCETKGCDFSTKRARPVVARVYQKMNEMARRPRVNARD